MRIVVIIILAILLSGCGTPGTLKVGTEEAVDFDTTIKSAHQELLDFFDLLLERGSITQEEFDYFTAQDEVVVTKYLALIATLEPGSPEWLQAVRLLYDIYGLTYGK